TIAILRPASQFRSEDLPTLGRPTITTLGKAMPLTSPEESSGGAPAGKRGKTVDDQAKRPSQRPGDETPPRDKTEAAVPDVPKPCFIIRQQTRFGQTGAERDTLLFAGLE